MFHKSFVGKVDVYILDPKHLEVEDLTSIQSHVVGVYSCHIILEMTYMNPSFKETGSRQFQPSSVNLTPGHLFGLQATQTPKIYERIGHSFRLQRGRKTHLTKRNWQQKAGNKAGASLNYQTHPLTNHKKKCTLKETFCCFRHPTITDFPRPSRAMSWCLAHRPWHMTSFSSPERLFLSCLSCGSQAPHP